MLVQVGTSDTVSNESTTLMVELVVMCFIYVTIFNFYNTGYNSFFQQVSTFFIKRSRKCFGYAFPCYLLSKLE